VVEAKALGGGRAILARSGGGGAISSLVVAKAHGGGGAILARGGGGAISSIFQSDHLKKLSVRWGRQGILLHEQLASVCVYAREELFLRQLGCRHGHHQYADVIMSFLKMRSFSRQKSTISCEMNSFALSMRK